MKQKFLFLVTMVAMLAFGIEANATATLTIKGTEVDLASLPKSGTTKVGRIEVGKDMTGKQILIELYSDVNDGSKVINVPDGKTLISYTGDEYDWIGVMIDSDLTINCKNSKMFYFQGSSLKYAQVEFMPRTSPGAAYTLTCNLTVTEAGYTRPIFDLAYTKLTLNSYTKRKLNLELSNTADKALIFNAFHSSYVELGYGDVHMVANDGATKYRFFGETNTYDMHVIGLGRFDSYDENNYLSTPLGAQIYDDIVLKDCKGDEIRGEVTLKYLSSQYAYFGPENYSDWRLVQDCSGEVTLQIKGAGDLSALDPATLPWKPYADLITKVEVSSDLMIPLTKLPKGAFADLKVLKSASLYNAMELEEISDQCFEGCEKLEEITFNEYAGALLSVGARAFMACEKLKEVVIPESVENIGDSAFLNCPLAEITLPVSLKTLGVRPFNTTKALILPKDIGEEIVNNNILPKLSAGAASFTGDDISLKYEGTMEEWLAKDRSWIMRFWSGTKAHLFIDGKEVVDLVIPEGVTEIKDNTFRDCKEIETVKFPSTLTKIGASAFRNNKKLTEVILPKAVSEIGEYCFDGCEALADLDLSDALTVIPEGAFSECSSLTMVDIPDAVTSIAAGAFEECENLEIVSFGEGIQKIDATAFIRCTKLETAGFMATIGEVEIDRTELEKELNDPDFLELKETEPEKYEMMYAYYSNLNPFMHVKTVALWGELTDWIKYDREWVMGHIQPASKLVRNNITNEVKEVSFAEGIKFISNYAFANIGSITSLTLPVSMESIGDSTFAGCANLAAVETKATVPPTLGKDAFAGIKEGAELTMPEEAIKEYVASDWAKYFDIFGGYTVTAASANAALGEVTLTFDDKDIISKGEEANSYVVGNKAKGHLVATPKDKYTNFVMWNDEAEGFDQAERDVIITGDFDYVAKFQKDSFNVAVEVKGIDPSLVKISGAGKYGRGDNVTLTFEMKDEHYDFDMWLFDKNNFEDEATLVFEEIDDNHDVQIVFKAKYYTVSATVIPEGAGVVKGQGDYEYGTDYTLTLEPAEGWELKEWRDGVVLEEATTNELTGFVYGAITVEVELQLKKYTVTYLDWNDAKLYEETVEHGKDAKGPESTPTREGYTFTGWDKEITKVTGDLTVTAQYEEAIASYTVTFLDWDGTKLYEEKVEEGKDAKGPESNPTREGYTFTGWSKPITNITGDLTVIALYKEIVVVDYTPKNLNAALEEKDGDTEITLSWDKVEGAISYELRVSANGMKLFSQNTMKLNVISRQLSALEKEYALTPGTYTIDWAVRSTDGIGDAISDWAEGKSFEVTVKDPATGLDDVQGDNVQCTKVFRDGVILIEREGLLYNLQGQMVHSK